MLSIGFFSSRRRDIRSFAVLLVLCLCVTMPVGGRAQTVSSGAVYTNVAGQVISGPALGVTNGLVRFGARWFPMSIFPKSEQERLLADCKIPVVSPSSVAKERRELLYRNFIQRQDALERAGIVSHEKAEGQRERIRRAWRMASQAGSEPSAASGGPEDRSQP